MESYIICTSPKGKSVTNYFFALAKALKDEGNDVILVVDQHYEGEKDFHGIGILTWPSRRPVKLKDFIFFYKVCKKYKPTVTVSQYGSTNIVLLVSWLLRIPNKFNYWHTMFNATKIDFEKNKIRPLIKHFFKKFFLKHIATQVFINSLENKRQLVALYKIDPDKVPVFHILIEGSEQNLINRFDQRNQQISFVGRMDKSKGHKFVINEIPEIIAAYPDLRFVFVGDGPERANLEQQCAALEIKTHVNFVGAKNMDDVYKIMSESLMNVSASLEEAFGLVNVEALSCGTPILAPQIGGIKEILSDSKNGFFFNQFEKTDLLKKINLIMGNWTYHSISAKESFDENFSLHNTELLKKQMIRIDSLLLKPNANPNK